MSEANAAQAKYWNGAPGRTWVDHDAWMTTTHRPLAALLLGRCGAGPGDLVLDIGCGTGSSTRAVAAQVAPGGRVTGLDISEALLAEARRLGSEPGHAPVEYLNADAQVFDFGKESYDKIVSQLGVMFFADPVAAFANIRRAGRPGAAMTLVCWGAIADNPWFLIPKQAAEAELAPAPAEPGAPSPTAFADRAMVTGLLAAAGWARVGAERVALELTPPGGLDGLLAMAFRIGPVARLMQHHGAGDDVAARIAPRIAKSFAAFETPDGFRVPAVVNLFTATNPG